MSSTAVVIVNYHSAALIERSISPELEAAVHKIIVVDNSSPDARELAVNRGWLYVPAPSNVGFGAACNLGAAEAEALACDRILFLNPDATIGVESLRMLENVVTADPLAMVCPTILDTHGRAWFEGARLSLLLGLARHDSGGGEPDWLTGACLMTSVAAFRQVGGFREDYFLYWEDVDLTYRARTLGMTLRVIKTASATHHVGGTQGDPGQKSVLYYKQNLSNRRRFARSHLPLAPRLAWAITTPIYVVTLLRRGGLLRRPLALARTLLAVALPSKTLAPGRG